MAWVVAVNELETGLVVDFNYYSLIDGLLV